MSALDIVCSPTLSRYDHCEPGRIQFYPHFATWINPELELSSTRRQRTASTSRSDNKQSARLDRSAISQTTRPEHCSISSKTSKTHLQQPESSTLAFSYYQGDYYFGLLADFRKVTCSMQDRQSRHEQSSEQAMGPGKTAEKGTLRNREWVLRTSSSPAPSRKSANLDRLHVGLLLVFRIHHTLV